jgi:hypothetical protein
MVNAKYCHCRVYRAITQGNVACGRTNRGREIARALRRHHIAGFNCNHVSILGFIRTGTSADVDDRPSVA